MDRYEYNLKLDQMKAFVAEGDYRTAAEIADTINWRKIKNVTALVRAGEIYEQVERYEESREILLMAYDRSSIGRAIIYRLACVAIKMRNFDEAKEFYKEFVEIAPHDNLKYVLKYEINKAQGADYKILISNLEDLKEQEFSEEWGYELAYTYHQAGMGEKCIEMCDEIILYFGQGPYVERALELKMLYQPLTSRQEERYRQIRQQKEGITEIRPEDSLVSGEIVTKAVEIPEVQMSPERFNTQNLQEALQKSMKKIMEATEKEAVEDHMDNIKKLAEEIPYLQMPSENEPEEEIPVVAEPIAEEEIQSNFREFLNEEYDGQMRILVPDGGVREPQVSGQMTMEEVFLEWENTRKAAEEALKNSGQDELKSVKAKALQEAGDIMERLADVIPKLESGMTSQDLLAKPYASAGVTKEDAAAQMVANMNQLLQREIDRLSTENAQMEEKLAVAQEIEVEQELAAFMQEIAAEQELAEAEHNIPEQPEDEQAETEEPIEEKEGFTTKELPKIELPTDINLEVSISRLSDEQKELFTYFTPIRGMEEQICVALSGIASRLKSGTSARTGNLIVQGDSCSGKTVFATNFVKALQQMTGKPDGKVGKIKAEIFNKKDINALYAKIAGGCLIIESAGELTQESAAKLSLLLENDTKGTLIILEDTGQGIEKALLKDRGLASKFTEQISIPIFTNDELVVFAKSYAKENGYRIDEMGVLAVYNSISSIEKLDKATSIVEVKEIVDNAIVRAEKGALRKAFSILTSSRFDDEDYVILHEKDFNI